MMEAFQPKPFGKYFLIEKLAMGGMAEIYKAKTFGVDGFEKLLAIKRILPHCSADQQFITMLTDEAKLSVLLSHTNIVQVYDFGKIKDDYFISMEYIDGINLRELLERLDQEQKLDEDLVVYVISEVCKGLDYAHSKKSLEGQPLNIVHRDISPQNILLSFEGEVKIVDFGIAKAAMNISHTQTGILKGKVTYMSPEQTLAKPINHKIDIFAAGVMLYEMLTGTRLFDGENHFEVLDKIRNTKLTLDSFPETIPLPLRQILAKALAYSAKDRYETAGDFQIDLTRYLYKTYFEFTPRKLSRFIKKIFAEEIETHKANLAQTPKIDPHSQNLLLEAAQQENIVHRENSGDLALPPSVYGATRSMTQGGPEFGGTPPMTMPTKGSSSSLTKMFLAALALVILAALGSFAYFRWWGPGSGKTGTIVLNSQPPGAKIFLDGSETNLVTPAEIKDMPLHQAKKKLRLSWRNLKNGAKP